MTGPTYVLHLTTEELRLLIAQALAGVGDEVLTAREAGVLLKAHENTVMRWARDGVVPGKKLGQEWRFSRAELLAHVRLHDLPQAAD